jgi:hypothetical protein
MSSLYAVVEPALVGGGVLFALGFALRRFVPRLRGGAAAGGCSSGCSSCGGCGSGTVPAPRKVKIVVHRKQSTAQPPLPQ